MASQIITPNPNINCSPGMCLEYVRKTYNLSAKYPTATTGWNASNHQHADKDFPEGIWLPLWFSLSDNPDGHVVLRQPDGSIWSASSPTATTPVHHDSIDDLQNYYDGRLQYLGWTEDIEDVLVVEQVAGLTASKREWYYDSFSITTPGDTSVNDMADIISGPATMLYNQVPDETSPAGEPLKDNSINQFADSPSSAPVSN